jgi:hypothetical protein
MNAENGCAPELAGERGAINQENADYSGDCASNVLENQHGAPTMPKPETRRAAVLEALRRGDHLTHIDGLARGWGWRLAADVFALKELHGWNIQSAMIPQSGANDIAVYWMDGSAK